MHLMPIKLCKFAAVGVVGDSWRYVALGPPVGEGLRKRKRHTQWCSGKVDNFCTVSLSLLVLLQECHCMLFLTDDNDFAGKDQEITIDEIREGVNGM